MTDINETKLPGVGTLHDFICKSGARIGVISHHADRREVIIYDAEDPDRVGECVTMTSEEARLLADLLGGSSVTQRLDDLRREIDGLAIDWLPVSPGSAYAGKTIGDAALRTRTGVSIVALIRGDQPIPAPGPDQDLLPNDTAVVVGTPDGIDTATKLLGLAAK